MSSALAPQRAEDRRAGIPAAVPEDDGALVIRGLSKRFGDTAAVVDVDLEVQRGAFFGLVGSNGAGKTTLLSMAVGLLEPDAGSVRVLGEDVWPAPGGEAAKQLLGIMPDGLALPGRLTGRELLTYVGGLRDLPCRGQAGLPLLPGRRRFRQGSNYRKCQPAGSSAPYRAVRPRSGPQLRTQGQRSERLSPPGQAGRPDLATSCFDGTRVQALAARG